MIETDITLADGRTLHVYDTGPAVDDLVVVWHHGTPGIGLPPEPLFADWPRLRWVSYDRPGCGRSTPQPARTMASAAECASSVADALGIDRFAVLGHSSGGPHALACAALLPDRVIAAASVSGLAPLTADDLDWFAGMGAQGVASLRAATEGRAAKAAYEASAEFDQEMFTPADHAALSGTWSWFQKVVGPAIEAGPGGLIDDDLANVGPWGFDVSTIVAPVLLQHGKDDRMVPASHSEWLARHCPSAELRLYQGEGHISVLNHASEGLDWLANH